MSGGMSVYFEKSGSRTEITRFVYCDALLWLFSRFDREITIIIKTTAPGLAIIASAHEPQAHVLSWYNEGVDQRQTWVALSTELHSFLKPA